MSTTPTKQPFFSLPWQIKQKILFSFLALSQFPVVNHCDYGMDVMGSMNMMKEAILKGHYPEKGAGSAMRAEESCDDQQRPLLGREEQSCEGRQAAGWGL